MLHSFCAYFYNFKTREKRKNFWVCQFGFFIFVTNFRKFKLNDDYYFVIFKLNVCAKKKTLLIKY